MELCASAEYHEHAAFRDQPSYKTSSSVQLSPQVAQQLFKLLPDDPGKDVTVPSVPYIKYLNPYKISVASNDPDIIPLLQHTDVKGLAISTPRLPVSPNVVNYESKS